MSPILRGSVDVVSITETARTDRHQRCDRGARRRTGPGPVTAGQRVAQLLPDLPEGTRWRRHGERPRRHLLPRRHEGTAERHARRQPDRCAQLRVARRRPVQAGSGRALPVVPDAGSVAAAGHLQPPRARLRTTCGPCWLTSRRTPATCSARSPRSSTRACRPVFPAISAGRGVRPMRRPRCRRCAGRRPCVLRSTRNRRWR